MAAPLNLPSTVRSWVCSGGHEPPSMGSYSLLKKGCTCASNFRLMRFIVAFDPCCLRPAGLLPSDPPMIVSFHLVQVGILYVFFSVMKPYNVS